MARADLVNVLYTKRMNSVDFHFDSLSALPLFSYLSQQDVAYLKSITLHPKLNSKIKEKSKLICEVMEDRFFKKLASGTNRICFKSLKDPNIVIKVALDEVGLKDNPAEYKNQMILKPFVTKCFEVSYDGEVGLFERVQPITSIEQFASIASDVFDLLNKYISGKYVLEDVGSNYFLNYGIRNGFGPVLLDYTYVYEIDGKKLICNNKDPYSPTGYCMGEIDYDIGFNNLICEKCGKRYFAIQLKKDIQNKNMVIKNNINNSGGIPMRIKITKGDQLLKEVEVGRNIKQTDFVPHESIVKVSYSSSGEINKEIREDTTDKVDNSNDVIETKPESDNTPVEEITVKPRYQDANHGVRPKGKKFKNKNRDNRPHNQNNNQQKPYPGKNDPNYYTRVSNNKGDQYNTRTSVEDTPKLDNDLYKNHNKQEDNNTQEDKYNSDEY